MISGVLRGPEVTFVEASKTAWLIPDVDGNTFADHHSSWGSAPLGADHPAVLEAVLQAQRRYGMECTDSVRSDVAVALAV